MTWRAAFSFVDPSGVQLSNLGVTRGPIASEGLRRVRALYHSTRKPHRSQRALTDWGWDGQAGSAFRSYRGTMV